jgi:hypothetical protein
MTYPYDMSKLCLKHLNTFSANYPMMTNKRIFAVIVPNEADLTVPIAAATELSKKYIEVQNKIDQLQAQTRTLRTVTEDGEEIISVVDHPDLKWWFDQGRRILSDIAKINANMEIKEQENKIKLLDLFMQMNDISNEDREKVAKAGLRKKVKIDFSTK